ncbi:MAG TPA: hypothetical protein VGJ91_07180 [Polyangiaceae bacterium]
MEPTPKSPLLLSTLLGNERLLAVALALTFYCLGTTFFEAFVNYRTWGLIGGREFAAYHRALTPRVVFVMLLPIGAYFLCLLALLVRRPPALPAWFLAVSLLLLSIAILSSLFVQVPMGRTRCWLSRPASVRRISATSPATNTSCNSAIFSSKSWPTPRGRPRTSSTPTG